MLALPARTVSWQRCNPKREDGSIGSQAILHPGHDQERRRVLASEATTRCDIIAEPRLRIDDGVILAARLVEIRILLVDLSMHTLLELGCG
jgi:hypothetical protein